MSFRTNRDATTVRAANMQISILLICIDPLFMNNEMIIHNLQPETHLADSFICYLPFRCFWCSSQ